MVRCTARARAGSGMRMVESMKSVRALIVDDSSYLIKAIEQSPDTVITLLNGEEILVQEPVNEIVARIVEFRRRVLPGWARGMFQGLVLPHLRLTKANDEGRGQSQYRRRAAGAVWHRR